MSQLGSPQQAMMAEVAGLNRESLYKALAGEGNSRFSTFSRGIKGLGCRLVVV
ncbi:MAG: DNA-binding protein [Candidatus Electrothrix sp. YB6]